MPDRLPPPPFWRTRYFAKQVINKPGRQIDPAEISATLATPARRVVQPDGRVRHWRWVATRGHRLRVVTEADGVTVHNAFFRIGVSGHDQVLGWMGAGALLC
jgi:hypothetical protein